MKRMATADPAHGKRGALEGPVLVDRLASVLGARWIVDAAGPEQRGDATLIKADAGEQGARGDGTPLYAAHARRRLS